MVYTIKKICNFFFSLMRILHAVLVLPFPKGDGHYGDVMEGLGHGKTEVRLKGLEVIHAEDKRDYNKNN